MKKQILLSAFLVAASYAVACTNFIVGKKASADGSVFCTYNADSYGAFMPLYHFPAGKHAPGEMRQIYDWDTNKYLGQIPEAAETWNVIGNTNEWQLTIGETTFGGREEMVDTTGIIDYGSLIYITLQRAKNAREAIQVMTTLVEQYGYCSEGETFSICDPNEAWIMEMMGCGSDRKLSKERTVWVALRIPDDMICAHANQSRIRQFDMKDKQNVLFSKNVVKYARKMGWFSGKDEAFSYADAYCPADFGARRWCEARVWSFFNRFSDDFSAYLPWALGEDPNAQPMPLWIKPNKLLTLQDMQAAMRDHFEGTPLSLDQDLGGGIWEMPYRVSPLSYKVDGQQYFNERPTSTQQSAFSFISQMRSWLPRQVGGCFWFGNDDGNMVSYVPIYCANTRQPVCFNTPGADDIHFSMDNAFWVCNWVANMVYPRYSLMFPSLKQVRDSLDAAFARAQPEIEAEAIARYANDEQALAAHMTDYSCLKAEQMMDRWRQLAYFLIVKYNDMVERPDRDGQFYYNENGLGQTIKRPGMPERFAREMNRHGGQRMKMPKK
ncbi:MAG: C69 family dipeptidase [Prevotella sp.]|nr:C69 family dipeptidase [Prevotella sp.]